MTKLAQAKVIGEFNARIEANKAELLKQFENMDIMEWYANQYVSRGTKET